MIEHLRLAQSDILEFSRDRGHVSPDWPAGYWPPRAAPPSEAAWRKSLAAFRQDLKAMEDLVRDPATDLYSRIPWGDGENDSRSRCSSQITMPTTWETDCSPAAARRLALTPARP